MANSRYEWSSERIGNGPCRMERITPSSKCVPFIPVKEKRGCWVMQDIVAPLLLAVAAALGILSAVYLVARFVSRSWFGVCAVILLVAGSGLLLYIQESKVGGSWELDR